MLGQENSLKLLKLEFPKLDNDRRQKLDGTLKELALQADLAYRGENRTRFTKIINTVQYLFCNGNKAIKNSVQQNFYRSLTCVQVEFAKALRKKNQKGHMPRTHLRFCRCGTVWNLKSIKITA